LAVLSRESVALDGGDLEAFDAALDELGFDPSEEVYRQTYFSSRGLDYYAVTDQFPRITPRTVAAGVSGVKYRLDLAALDEFAIGGEAALSPMKSYEDI
jgi:hypothetical protein